MRKLRERGFHCEIIWNSLCNWLSETCLYIHSFFHYLSLSLWASQSLTLRLLCFDMASRPRTRRRGVEPTDKRERCCKYPTRDPETFFKIVFNEKILVCVFFSLNFSGSFSVLFLNETLWGLLRCYMQVLHCLFLWFFLQERKKKKKKIVALHLFVFWGFLTFCLVSEKTREEDECLKLGLVIFGVTHLSDHNPFLGFALFYQNRGTDLIFIQNDTVFPWWEPLAHCPSCCHLIP